MRPAITPSPSSSPVRRGFTGAQLGGESASGAGGIDVPRQEPRVIRSRPARRSAQRNLLADFDALIERTMVASCEGRDPQPFLDDAVRLARKLAGACVSEDPEHLTRAVTLMSAQKMAAHKDAVEERVRRGIAAAIRALDELAVNKSERHASTVKYFVRSIACECTRPWFSYSGRAVW